jgi:hypothetical protein
MDMWDPYIDAVKAHIPAAERKIIFDKLHVVQHMSWAVDKVHREENKTLVDAGNARLKWTKYLWRRSPEQLSAAQQTVALASGAGSAAGTQGQGSSGRNRQRRGPRRHRRQGGGDQVQDPKHQE